jgi:serine/threonine protein kinase
MEEPEFLTSWQGTTGYMAPEIHDKKYKAYEVDIFAAGVALFIMIFRMPPFESSLSSNPDYNLIRKGKFEDFWKKIEKRVPASMPLKRMLTKIFALNASIRPSLS